MSGILKTKQTIYYNTIFPQFECCGFNGTNDYQYYNPNPPTTASANATDIMGTTPQAVVTTMMNTAGSMVMVTAGNTTHTMSNSKTVKRFIR